MGATNRGALHEPVSLDPDHYEPLSIPSLPRTQVLTSTTFSLPPLDGSMSIPYIFDWHLEHSPNHPLFEYAEPNGDVETITWAKAVRAVHEAGYLVREQLGHDINLEVDNASRPVVAILAATDFITFFTFVVGVMRAGYTAFFISPRNSAAAVAHLMTVTKTSHVFVGSEVSLKSLAADALQLLSSPVRPEMHNMVSFEDIYLPDAKTNGRMLPHYCQKMCDSAFILHSSGSTAYPKPIPYSHIRYLMWGFTPFWGDRDKTGMKLSSHNIPMFHGMGLIQTAWVATCGLVICAHKPQTPAMPITAESVIQGAAATNPDIVFCVPQFVEEWARSPECVEILRRTKGILFGGGPLSKDIGDYLVDQGIPVYPTYGIAECGMLSPLIPKEITKEWEYFQITDNIGPRFLYDISGQGEVLFVPTKYHIPSVLNTVIDGKPAYATHDYLSPHPTKPGWWKIVGRVDDQIMHSTGEKTNPGPLEAMLSTDPHVRAAVMFGRGKLNAGIIVDPSSQHRFDPSDATKVEQFKNVIWHTIERINTYAPQHSRIFREMILISLPSKPFSYTAKLNPRRQAILADYEDEIENLYASVGDMTQVEVALPVTWDLENIRAYVSATVRRVLKYNVEDGDDIFQYGCDSLQATWIRNTLLHSLRKTLGLDTSAIPTGFVYRNPSIDSLSSFILDITQTHGISVGVGEDNTVHEMLNMVARYSDNFPTHIPSKIPSQTGSDVVLLTGSTGGLGVILLSILVQSPEVAKVYAINRRTTRSKTLLERQQEALRTRGLNEDIATSCKVMLIETDTADPQLGLDGNLFEEIRSSVTHILHNAYRVDFNLSLSSFEPQVKSTRNLIDLALLSPRSTPPRLLFTSSVSVLHHLANNGVVSEKAVPPEAAVCRGYGESKWVCERLLDSVAEQTPLRPIVVRVGQIAGNVSGAWNHSEWFPTLLRSSVHLGCIPTLDKEISWLPADVVGQAIYEMRNSNAPFLHLAHPRPVPISTILQPLASELNLSYVTYEEWLSKLEKSKDEASPESEIALMQNIPALRMLDFYHSAISEQKEAFGAATMDVSEALRVAPCLRKDSLSQLSSSDALSWLNYWKRVGFM